MQSAFTTPESFISIVVSITASVSSLAVSVSSSAVSVSSLSDNMVKSAADGRAVCKKKKYAYIMYEKK